jgi:DnaK suppressor protein
MTTRGTRYKEPADIMYTTTKAVPKAGRFKDLKATLEGRRWELAHDLRDKIRTVRNDRVTDRDGVDAAERSEADIQDDLGFAVLQLTAETLEKIDAALRRIEDGDYGECFECGGEIADARLRALPFAVRCRCCEAVREATDRREGWMGSRGLSAHFVDSSSERSGPAPLARR